MNFNDLLIDNQGFPLFPEIFLVDPPQLFTPSNETCPLLSQLEHLTVDCHTQLVRIEVERVKYQKIRALVKKIKQKRMETDSLLLQTLRENNML